MPEKDPSNYHLLTYVWVIILAIWEVSCTTSIKSERVRHYAIKAFKAKQKEPA